MAEFQVKRLTKALQAHDSLLFAQETRLGRYDVYRKSSFSCNPPHYIFSLTHDWSVGGTPVEWSVDIAVNRIKAHDLWRDESYIDEVFKQNQLAEDRRSRVLKNSIESFLYEFRSQFAKATDSVNTGTLKKLYRKENSHGYCESGTR